MRKPHLSQLWWTLMVVVCGAVPSAAQQQQAQMTDAEIRTVLRERTEGPRRTVGVVIGLIDEHGVRIFSHGRPQLDSAQTLNGDSLFKLASITKVFTAILLADMAERGEVSLDDPISKYLPSSVKVPTRDGKEILLRSLATHTSGLPANPDDMSKESYSVEKMYAFLSGVKLTREIGSEYAYSNIGMALLAHILASRAGTDYETLVRTRVLKPLQMNDTRNNLTPEARAQLPLGYVDGKPLLDPVDPYAPFGGVGALYSTANDLMKFIEANLGLKKTSLLPALEKTHQLQHAAYADVGIGLGWHIIKGDGGGPGDMLVWHDGAGGGQRTFLGFLPSDRRGVAMFWNSEFDLTDIGIHLLDDSNDLKKALKPVALDAKTQDSFVGKYQLESKPEVTFNLSREGNRMFGQMTGERMELFAASDSELFFGEVEVEFTIVKDDSGRVTRVIAHQGGQDQAFRKIQ